VPADLLAVLLAALVGLLLPRAPRADPSRLLSRADPDWSGSHAGSVSPGSAFEMGPPTWAPRVAGVSAAAAVLTGHGVAAAVCVVATLALSAPGVLARAHDRRERAESARELPRVADLLAAGLQAGLPLPSAVSEVCRVVHPSTAGRLRRLAVGLEPGSTAPGWLADGHGSATVAGPAREAPADAGWLRLSRALERALASGAPLAEVLVGLAADERERTRWAAEEAARRVGVRAVGPLAACFLPAFVLVGVVPVVVGVAGAVLGDLG
jgi:Flp pilus assembly protein TadB